METLRSELEVALPERVSLALPIVGFGHRAMAYLLDVTLQGAFWLTGYFIFTSVVDSPLAVLRGLSNWVIGLLAAAFFCAQWVYWTACETLMEGQTFGKRWVGIRVVKEDGSTVDFISIAVRNLLRAVDFLPMGYGVGGIAVLLSKHHRRLGDWAAGTVLTLDQPIELGRYRSTAAESSTSLAPTTPLSSTESELILEFLARFQSLEAGAQQKLLRQMLDRFGNHLPLTERERLCQLPTEALGLLEARAKGQA